MLVIYLTWVVRCLGLIVSPFHRDGDGFLVPGVAVVGVGHLAHRHAAGLQDLQHLVLVGGLGQGGDVKDDPLRHLGIEGLVADDS